ncbi:hypothetical protein TUM1881_51760 (plasmid) [Escherichia coli]|nr:hypothetical protein TUM1881_11680 [Escherichia coli]BDO52602.1 hypothetical protein TUM1881_51760 [Escherichia coli]
MREQDYVIRQGVWIERQVIALVASNFRLSILSGADREINTTEKNPNEI